MEESAQAVNPQPANPIQPQQSSKSSFKPIFIVVVFILILSMAAFIVWPFEKNRQQSTGQNTTSPTKILPTIPTTPTIEIPKPANWQTYSTAEFKFMFPSSWIYETEKSTIEINGRKYASVLLIAGTPLNDKERSEYLNKEDAPKMIKRFYLEYATNADFLNLTPDDLVRELIKSHAQVSSEKKFVQGNIRNGIEVEYSCQAGCTGILFRNGKTVFEARNGPSNEDASELRDVLSTIKFTD